MAAFGTDHDLMQRLLTVETRGESQRTLALTPIGTLVTLLIYLGLGAGLFTYYTQHPAPALSAPRRDPAALRRARSMPPLLRGLMLAAIVLSSIDSPLGSLARLVRDRHLPALLVRNRSEQHYLPSRATRCSSSGSCWGCWPGRLPSCRGQIAVDRVFEIAG